MHDALFLEHTSIRHKAFGKAYALHSISSSDKIYASSLDNGGMGSFYRSRHELVFVFRNGSETHLNNVQLGKYGRYRTNVWEYPGVNSFGGGRMDELALHPTVKPVDMRKAQDALHRSLSNN